MMTASTDWRRARAMSYAALVATIAVTVQGTKRAHGSWAVALMTFALGGGLLYLQQRTQGRAHALAPDAVPAPTFATPVRAAILAALMMAALYAIDGLAYGPGLG